MDSFEISSLNVRLPELLGHWMQQNFEDYHYSVAMYSEILTCQSDFRYDLQQSFEAITLAPSPVFRHLKQGRSSTGQGEIFF
jgi:hypothetical protein